MTRSHREKTPRGAPAHGAPRGHSHFIQCDVPFTTVVAAAGPFATGITGGDAGGATGAVVAGGDATGAACTDGVIGDERRGNELPSVGEHVPLGG